MQHEAESAEGEGYRLAGAGRTVHNWSSYQISSQCFEITSGPTSASGRFSDPGVLSALGDLIEAQVFAVRRHGVRNKLNAPKIHLHQVKGCC